jgi:hypothetical protein
MIRIALHGELTLAQNYIEIIRDSDRFILSGIYCGNGKVLIEGNMIDQPALIFKAEDDLIRSSDVIIFLNYDLKNFDLIKRALKESRHVFISPGDIIHPEYIDEIQKLGDEAGVLYRLRHNIIGRDLQKYLIDLQESPEFIDIYRYIPVNKELNESEIHKIIRKEILFAFSVHNRELKKFSVKTVPYCSEAPYIVNIRLDFANSATANLTINFFTHDNSRYAELFFSEKMIRINTNPGLIEYIDRKEGNFIVEKKPYNYQCENYISEELKQFLILLLEKKLAVDYSSSGLSIHKNIWHILNQISQLKTNPVNEK